jgi:hypothetical protein
MILVFVEVARNIRSVVIVISECPYKNFLNIFKINVAISNLMHYLLKTI